MKYAGIIGTGRSIPEKIVTNDDLSTIIQTNDEWIYSRTGIKERRISMGEDTSALAYEAGRQALEEAGVPAGQLDAIIVATYTPDYLIPSTACIVQGLLKAENAFAFDVSAACSGFVYALSVGDKYIRSGQYNNVLVIGADVTSKVLNWADRSTCVLFGDGAGAVVLSAAESEKVGPEDIHSDGGKFQALTAGKMPPVNPFIGNQAPQPDYMAMDGRQIFDFALRKIPQTISSVLDKAGLILDDITYIIPHQANTRIIDAIAKRLKTPREKFYTNMERYSNTSGASIPIALDELNKNGYLKKGDKVLLCGFGGGLTWGSIMIEW